MKNMPFLEFVRELKNLCQTEVTGTLSITTENNKIILISLNKGQIVFMSMLGKTGLDALPLIRQTSNCSYQLLKGTLSTTRASLPSTAYILQMLTVTGQDEKTNLSSISAQAKTVLKETLQEFLGPIASFVCDQHLAKVDDLNSAITILASEIPDKSDAIKFKDSVQKKLS